MLLNLQVLPAVEPSPPAAKGAVATWSRVDEIVQAALAGKFSEGNVTRYGDGHFYLPTLDEVNTILTSSQLDRRTWLAERFDCDDFSYVLKGEFSVHAYDAGDISFGFCLGMIWGNFAWVQGFHAVNWCVTSDGTFRLIEPQSDQLYAAADCSGGISLFVV